MNLMRTATIACAALWAAAAQKMEFGCDRDRLLYSIHSHRRRLFEAPYFFDGGFGGSGGAAAAADWDSVSLC